MSLNDGRKPRKLMEADLREFVRLSPLIETQWAQFCTLIGIAKNERPSWPPTSVDDWFALWRIINAAAKSAPWSVSVIWRLCGGLVPAEMLGMPEETETLFCEMLAELGMSEHECGQVISQLRTESIETRAKAGTIIKVWLEENWISISRSRVPKPPSNTALQSDGLRLQLSANVMPDNQTQSDREVIYLLGVWEAIENLVNFALFDLLGDGENRQVIFKDSAHQTLFNILLVDFLSPTDSKGPVPSKEYLGALQEIVKEPSIGSKCSATELDNAVTEFVAWLDTEVTVDVWLASIAKQVELRITRKQFLRMAGNTSKHNFLRLARVAESFKKIVAKSGVTIDSDEALLALSDFHARFHTDILNYHSSTVCEFLNNIRWAMFHYLTEEVRSAYVPSSDDGLGYAWRLPAGLSSPYSKECAWELFNALRSPPYMLKFRVSRWLKLRY